MVGYLKENMYFYEDMQAVLAIERQAGQMMETQAPWFWAGGFRG
jgi:hypothetical protein